MTLSPPYRPRNMKLKHNWRRAMGGLLLSITLALFAPGPADSAPIISDPRLLDASGSRAGSRAKYNSDVAVRLHTSAQPDVSITKQVIGSDFGLGDPITFTLTIANRGSDTAANIVVTDVVPSQVSIPTLPTFDSTLAITPTGGLSYVWSVQPLGIGEVGVITIYGRLDSVSVFTNTATISDPEDETPGNNSSSVVVGRRKLYLPVVLRSWSPSVTGERKLYLPVVLKGWPPPYSGTLYPIADTDVRQGSPTTNFGSTTDMWVGYDHVGCTEGSSGQISRSLIQFDLSSIPAGDSVAKATLYLFQESCCDIGDRTHIVTVYRTSASWSESSVTWDTQPDYAEAYGSASVTSGAWQWYSFDVTDLVREWLDGSFRNYGFMIRGPEGSGNDSARLGFATREYGGTEYAPHLSIVCGGTATVNEVPIVSGIPNPTGCCGIFGAFEEATYDSHNQSHGSITPGG